MAKPSKPVRAPVASIVQTTVPLSLSFIGGRGFVSGAIERLSFGPLSHVDAVAADSWLWGSRSDKCKSPDGSTIGPGTKRRPPGYYGNVRCRYLMTLQLAPAVSDAYWKWLESQLDRPYNWIGVAAMPLGRNWREDDSWFCSEWQARAGEVAKAYSALFTPCNRVTPQMLATIWSALGATIVA